jgi:hypothetical protein
MDRIQETLTTNEVSQILGMLSRASIAYVNGAAGDSGDLYDTALDCKEGGAWTWTTAGSMA